MSAPKIPGRLEAWRIDHGPTHEAIGERVGRTQSTVQRWFARDQVPAGYQGRVAQLLGVRVGWVAGDGGPPMEPGGEGEAFAAGRLAGLEEAIRLLATAIRGGTTLPAPPEATVAEAFEEAAPLLPPEPPVPVETPVRRRRKG